MNTLEYQLGRIDINQKNIYFRGDDPYYPSLLFVVKAQDNTVTIYVQATYRHFRIVAENKLDETTIVGGGSCFVNPAGHLFLGDFSGDYGAISMDAAYRFGELLILKCEKLNIPVKGMIAEPEEKKIHPFWK